MHLCSSNCTFQELLNELVKIIVAMCPAAGKGLRKSKCPAVRKVSGISAKPLFLII